MAADEHGKQELLRWLSVAKRVSAGAVALTTAAGALLLAQDAVNPPVGLASTVGSIGVNVLSDLIMTLARGGAGRKSTEWQIQQQLESALEAINAADLLSVDEFRDAIRDLFLKLDFIEFANQQGEAEIVRQLQELDRQLSDIAGEVSQRLRMDQAGAAASARAQALQEYLIQLHQYCDELPYLLLRGDRPLSNVYIQQNTEQQVEYQDSISAEPRVSAAGAAGPARRSRQHGLETIDQALGRHSNLLLVAGPGMGKTTLLRYQARILAKAWNSIHLVPVLVSARGLATDVAPFSESLRRQVGRELGLRLQDELPSGFFSGPPASDAVWLVMVDGIDEVGLPAKRHELIQGIISHSEKPYYRFLVTSRPLPELGRFSPDRFAHYFLRPFDRRQIHSFAEKWFGAQREKALRFVRDLEDSRIADLAEVPLLLAMAAKVYEQEGKLPERRTRLYRKIVDLLLGEKLDNASIIEQWKTHGTISGAAAEAILSNLQTLVAYLALWQQQGGRRSLIDEAADYANTQGWLPATIIHQEWLRTKLGNLLRDTGLVFGRGVDTFLHGTIRAYLAACSVGRDHPDPEAQAAWTYVSRWQDPVWREFVLFLLSIWSDGGQGEEGRGVGNVVARIAAQGEAGLLFAGAALAEGAHVSPETAQAITQELLARAAGMMRYATFLHPNPIDVLVHLSNEEAVAGLENLARAADIEPAVRAQAAAALGRLGRVDQATLILTNLARAQDVGGAVQVQAAEALGRMGLMNIADSVLCGLARSRRVSVWTRTDALAALERLDRSDDLLELANDKLLDPAIRLRAAEALERLLRTGDAVRVMLDLADNITLDGWMHLQAAEALARMGEIDHAASILRAVVARWLANSPQVDMWMSSRAVDLLDYLDRADELVYLSERQTQNQRFRNRALGVLVRLQDIGRLLLLARDREVSRYLSVESVQALERLRAVNDLFVLARDQKGHILVRSQARHSIERLGDVEKLLMLAESTTIDARTGLEVVESLKRLHSVDGLIRLARNKKIAAWLRCQAARAMDHLANLAGTEEPLAWSQSSATEVALALSERSKVLQELAVDRQLDHLVRWSAMEGLKDEVDTLRMLAWNRGLDPEVREQIAEALFRFGEMELAAEAILELVNAGGVDPLLHCRVAEVFAWCGRIDKAAEILEQLGRDTSAAIPLRWRATEGLLSIGRSETVADILRQMAESHGTPLWLRGEAVLLLQRLGRVAELRYLRKSEHIGHSIREMSASALDLLRISSGPGSTLA